MSTLWLFPFSSHHGVTPIKGSNALDLCRTLSPFRARRGVSRSASVV
ncbi:MAG: hypothetical protein MPF33_10100 [Candidatus Aramenus sp.]|nr:hypothetical protein [Candidatus Aramenus sp.]